MPTPKTVETAALLARIRLFAAFSEEELQAAASLVRRKSYAPGECLFIEGEPCDSMFLLTEGSVRIFKSSASGREILLAQQSAPASIAEIPVFDGGPYPASATAVDQVSAYLIAKDDFRRLCREHPDLTLKLLAVVGARLRGLVAVLHQVTFGGVRQRLARTLLDFEQQSGGSPFRMPETHQELAGRLGTVREVISRNLSRFQSQGFIRIDNRQVWVDDRAGLLNEAETEMR